LLISYIVWINHIPDSDERLDVVVMKPLWTDGGFEHSVLPAPCLREKMAIAWSRKISRNMI